MPDAKGILSQGIRMFYFLDQRDQGALLLLRRLTCSVLMKTSNAVFEYACLSGALSILYKTMYIIVVAGIHFVEYESF